MQVTSLSGRRGRGGQTPPSAGGSFESCESTLGELSPASVGGYEPLIASRESTFGALSTASAGNYEPQDDVNDSNMEGGSEPSSTHARAWVGQEVRPPPAEVDAAHDQWYVLSDDDEQRGGEVEGHSREDEGERWYAPERPLSGV